MSTILVAVLTIFVVFISSKLYRLNKGPVKYPGPPPHFLLGSLSLVKKYGGPKKAHQMFAALEEQFGALFEVWFFGRSRLIVTDPVLVQQVITDTESFPDRIPGGFSSLIPLSLLGLRTSPTWVQHRKLLAPLFTERHMRGYASSISEECKILIEKLSNTEMDIRHTLVALTADVIGITGYGVRFNTLTSDANFKYLLATRVMFADVLARTIEPKLVTLFQFERRRASREAFNLFSVLVDEVLAAQDSSSETLNMVAVLSKAGLSKAEIKDEAVGMLLAGHETTANALCWLFLTLARHPEYLEKIQSELDAVMGDRKYPVYEDLPKLVFCKQCINESMRLFATVTDVPRICQKDTELGGYPVLKGQGVVISVYAMAHSSRVFKDPTSFRPERFASSQTVVDGAEAHTVEVPPYSFLPFGGGPRTCVGRSFALQEILLVLASVCKNLNFTLSPKTPANILEESSITLAPATEIVLQFESR